MRSFQGLCTHPVLVQEANGVMERATALSVSIHQGIVSCCCKGSGIGAIDPTKPPRRGSVEEEVSMVKAELIVKLDKIWITA